MRVSRRTFLGAGMGLAGMTLGGIPLDALASSPKPPQTLAEKVGQLFVVSFAGTTPEAAILDQLRHYHFGGVIIYGRNYASPNQLVGLVRGLQQASRYPLLVCTDQEGGSVTRITTGERTFPAEATYGHTGSAQKVQTDAATTARELRALGLTLNLAPVVDVLSNPSSPIGTRSYGSNPQEVARLSSAAISGYQSHGMGATAKHFIGLGHTSIDSHQALPVVNRTLAQLNAVDMVPFRAAVSANVSTILVAHVALPMIDSVHRPASLSPVIIGGLIRKNLGFKGAIMTDSLIMGAINIGTAEAAEAALAAGADILLVGSDKNIAEGVFDEAVNRVMSAVRSGRIPESRLDDAVTRILTLKRWFPATVV